MPSLGTWELGRRTTVLGITGGRDTKRTRVGSWPTGRCPWTRLSPSLRLGSSGGRASR
jgi:hypothetical protein